MTLITSEAASVADTDHAQRKLRGNMGSENGADTVKNMRFYKTVRAAASFFIRLEEKADASSESIGVFAEEPGCPQRCSDMDIVSAGMHDAVIC